MAHTEERRWWVTVWLSVLSLLLSVVAPATGWFAIDHIATRTTVAAHGERLASVDQRLTAFEKLIADQTQRLEKQIERIRIENNEAHEKISQKLDDHIIKGK